MYALHDDDDRAGLLVIDTPRFGLGNDCEVNV